MKNLKLFLKSGILESYVLGHSTPQETDFVEQMAVTFNEVRAEIDSINEAFELYAFAHAVKPDPMVKPFVVATIDFTERMKNGEQPSFLPELHQGSKVEDFSEWLNKPDMSIPVISDDIYAKVIGFTPKALTAIVWIKNKSSPEVHDDEYEKFLIVEGTCNITVGEEIYSLASGDYFSIPLHKNHQVIVTSSIPCKVILQRIAA